MTGSAKQSRAASEDWIASSLTLPAMTVMLRSGTVIPLQSPLINGVHHD
jgi:hypothetical protein